MTTLTVHGWITASRHDVVVAFPDADIRRDSDDLDDMTVVGLKIDGVAVEAVIYDGDPTATIVAAPSRADAEKVATRLGQPLLAVGYDRWKVLRQDDNGNTFTVTSGQTFDDAITTAANYEARGHRQTYWVEPDRPA